MPIEVSPGIVLIAGAALLPLYRGRLRDALLLGLPLSTLLWVCLLPEGTSHVRFLTLELSPLRVDALGRLFGIVFSIMAFLGGLYALRQQRVVELVCAYVYAGSAIGVVLAGDLVTVFVYWEFMALASTGVVMCGAGPRIGAVARRYFVMHMLGGAFLLAGIVGIAVQTGSLAFDSMTLDGWPAAMVLAGFLVNAAAPPLGAWVADAYPEASFSGTVFLSAFTTKTAVYVLMRGFPGAEILIPLGLVMAFYGTVYALLENDMRRLLSYTIVNQLGFMLTGVGIGTEMALNGVAAHVFAHIYMALLLMSAGSVLYMTGKRRCSDLGGLFQSMPVTAACGIIGALSIAAFPFTSGFVSKSMVSTAAASEHLTWTWMLLVAASAGVVLHAGLKFPWFVFFHRDSGLRPPDPPASMKLAMVLSAALCVLIGVFPQPLYALLPYPVDYAPYTWAHLVSGLQLLLFSGLAFFLMLPAIRCTLTITLEPDWLYRRVGAALGELGLRGVAAAGRVVGAGVGGLGRALVRTSGRAFGPASQLALVGHTGRALLLTLIVLLVTLWIGLSV